MMTAWPIFRKFLALFLAQLLLLTMAIPGNTTAVTEETIASTEETLEPTLPETTAATAAETTEAVLPPETTLPEETSPEEALIPEETEPVQSTEAEEETAAASVEAAMENLPELPYNLYFGLLHAHTEISDGTGTVEAAFRHASGVENLDFFAVTDHSNSFDHAEDGAITIQGSTISAQWAAGKAAAAAVTDETFLGIFGYEMTWQEGKHLGHISTFCTPGWQSRNQGAFENQPTALEAYYQVLTTVPDSVSQLNHPGTFYGNFENFGHYDADYDSVIHLLEVGGEGNFTAYDQYDKALAAGWHLSPSTSQNNHKGHWGDASDVRTVVLAETLTEESLFDAIRHHRVYASDDRDLRIYFELNGETMGSVIPEASRAQVTAILADPSDDAVGRVEVIGEGGAVLASRTMESAAETVDISLPGGQGYYYLRITQPDGDIAVTSPVWMESYNDLGISGFSCDKEVPVQNQPVELTLTVYNDEMADFKLESVECFLDGQSIHVRQNPGTVKARDSFSHAFSCTHPGMGVAELRAVVTGSILGQHRSFEKTLTLRFRSGQMVSGILVDGAHGNSALTALTNLKAIAAKASMDVTVFSGEMPGGGEVLLVTAPEETLEQTFLEDVKAFVQTGGTLILCGRAGENDQLNRLLEYVGASMRFGSDTAVDDVNNGGSPEKLYPTVFNTASAWCQGILDSQVYRHGNGCTVEPGNGTWLVKGFATTHSARSSTAPVLLAVEEVSGGRVFAAGCCFLSDDAMPQQKNRWDVPSANQTILENILGAERSVLPLTDMEDLYLGEIGTLYRIQGYVTAGTANEFNTFPDTIYLQDDTAGIAVVSFDTPGIQVGAPLEVVGYLDLQNGNPVLELVDFRELDEDFYRYAPKTKANKTAMDYDIHGGELMQVEGKVVELTKTKDGKGISRLVLKDLKGDLATILIEDCIFSGSTGKNLLASDIKKDRTVRAMGICHLDENGETVLRVRNCEEVVYVPPKADPSNPKTGDWLFWI